MSSVSMKEKAASVMADHNPETDEISRSIFGYGSFESISWPVVTVSLGEKLARVLGQRSDAMGHMRSIAVVLAINHIRYRWDLVKISKIDTTTGG
ncbi:hypothetical protein AG1IA_10372 [Rhizoctonia solani AG-1 IA]|uniref:Uncharacterized protein n=1 Tax=Thanatephorus cucumeris (strain AG1-IA) TaxID=983506 RepID=L8WFN6_THACA|nr:hypothetical protein AG1IA_10372 [Rhizoctonia solani AG-1 IA]